MTRTLRIITALLTFQLFARGLDYATGNPHQGAGVFQVESLDPPMVWGTVCIIASVITTAGLIKNWNRVIRDGAVFISAIYLVFAAMVIGDIRLHPLDDWRFFTGYITAAGVWATIAFAVTIRMAVIQNRKESNG
ncbi:hypothetical protein [Corynebacterium marquesiae]|uniref:hypothetical protein n=1 Tax=Corynebacterium marquesiae TaxID=2913503 RepID=UPI0022BA3865|nr:hypothetical protein [Corynebacterium marquesiae]MCZ9300473.1 hypothetical protein [Corynebacterium marquesiae]